MRVHVVPGRLRLATSLLVLTLPLTAVHVLLVTRAPWWKIPYQTVELWCVSVGLIMLPIAIWLLQGRRWAPMLLNIFGVTWAVVGMVAAAKQASPLLAFFSANQLMFFLGLSAWIKWETGKSYFDPQLTWYMGRPPLIPGLGCELTSGDARTVLRVARLDDEGAFLFGDQRGIFRLRARSEAEMIFSYKDAQVRCRGMAIRSVQDRTGGYLGAGFQFTGMSADGRKDLGDFVEQLRGEGHV